MSTDAGLDRVLNALALELPAPVWDDATARIRSLFKAAKRETWLEGYSAGLSDPLKVYNDIGARKNPYDEGSSDGSSKAARA